MSQINSIRDLYAKGESFAAISRKTGNDVKTIKKYIEKDDFSPVKPKKQKKASILDEYVSTINQWLEEDRNRWFKQRHTAQRVYDRLVNELGFSGSYSTVQRYVKSWREENKQQRSFQELVWHKGEAQVDAGEADFIVDGSRRRLYYLTLSFPYSNHSLTQVIYDVKAISICQALKQFFTHMSAVPSLIVFDNATGVGRKIGKDIHECKLFAEFRAHYGFDIRFCNPYSGHEKGHVESKVGYTRRNLFVPERCFVDLSDFNKKLLKECERLSDKKHYLKNESVSDLFKDELSVMAEPNEKDFDVCEYKYLKTDAYGKICIDGKHYYGSSPYLGKRKLLVRVRAYEVTIYDQKDREICTYPRVYGSKATISVKSEKTLSHLSTHPGAWFNSILRENLEDMKLKEIIDNAPEFERKQILNTWSKLSEKYDYDLALDAIKKGLFKHHLDFESVSVIAARLKDGGIDVPSGNGPDLSQYDKMFLEV